MFRRFVGMALLLLLLAACGAGGTSTSTPATPAAPTESTASAGPEAIVNQALDALAARDEATLAGMFDESVGNLKNQRAFESVRDWTALQSDAQVPGALGPVKSRQVQPAEMRGQTTVIPVTVTHERGTARWEFSLLQTSGGWRLLDIHGQQQE